MREKKSLYFEIMLNHKNTKKMNKIINDLKETQRKLMVESILNIINLIDELKQSENEKYDEIEKIIKQGLYLIKYIINSN